MAEKGAQMLTTLGYEMMVVGPSWGWIQPGGSLPWGRPFSIRWAKWDGQSRH